ncbi:SusC/RagA family TonB-linked outer membrane protein [Chryseolinea lacunae]|uniref:TonB-dependent receptor n=1 Tax=Chryseolinea lacunae TaxID=2801331 RepID=A0ABS1L256_9BACT|nr:TonB-dependent receptor [Chryseolinea lacunae]MBL0745779.1 TonB-dependent receptor [Chryseolinea lacunae]
MNFYTWWVPGCIGTVVNRLFANLIDRRAGCFFALLISAFLWPMCLQAQSTKVVSGVVYSGDTDERFPGVNILVENTTQGTSTNENGEFTIDVPNENSVLVFSFIGYLSQKIKVGSQSKLEIRLTPDEEVLDEVVVIGYGEAKKSDLVGSVGHVKTTKFQESGYGNFQQAFAGRVAGVVVNETSGQPGSALSVEIRGASSLNFSTQPLYVIDGIPLESPNVGALNSNANLSGGAVASPLASINPNDIASIEILKDASATAIYGSRGANGVVLITTKSGQKGKTKIEFNYSTSVATPLKQVDVLGAADFAQMANEAYRYRNPASDFIPYLESDIPNLVEFNPQKAVTVKAVTQDANISISGGENRSRYYISGQFFNQQGLIKSTGFKRYNFKVNYENEITSKLILNTSINLTASKSNGNLTSDIIQTTQRWAPILPFYTPDGTLNPITVPYYYGTEAYDDPTYGRIYYNARFPITEVISRISPNSYATNPANYIDGNIKGGGTVNINTNTQILGNATLTYKISKDLKLAGVLGVTSYSGTLENYLPSTILPVFTTQRGVASLGNLQSNKVLYQATLSYDKKFAKHNLNAVVGATAEKYIEKRQTVSSQGFVNDLTGVNAIQAGQVPQAPVSDYSGYQLLSSIFRTSYNYDDRYYLTVSARYDGSSKFAEDNRFGFFPSVGASWRIVNEKFIKDLQALSELKLRASYGVIGNQALGPYNTLSTLSAGTVMFGNAQANAAYSPSRLPNPGLTWEKTSQTNIGLDLGLFKDRVSLQVDLYQKMTDDLLYTIDLPGTTGFTSYTKNAASVKNEGLEIALSTVNVETGEFSWSTSFNIAFNRNLVNRLAGNSGEFLGINQLIGNSYLFILEPGKPIGQFFGLKAEPVWNEETIKTKPATFQPGAREGDMRYADINNDGLLTNDDRVFIGSALPQFTGGFRTELRFRNFDLAAFFNFSYGNKIFNQNDWILTNMSGDNNVYQKTFDARYIPLSAIPPGSTLEAVQANNATTRVPTPGSTFDRREVSDFYIEDGSFLRCKDINIGYTFPRSIISNLRISNLKVYANLQNLVTWTRYSGFNPEVGAGSLATRGLDNGSYPIFRNYRLGVMVTF